MNFVNYQFVGQNSKFGCYVFLIKVQYQEKKMHILEKREKNPAMREFTVNNNMTNVT